MQLLLEENDGEFSDASAASLNTTILDNLKEL